MLLVQCRWTCTLLPSVHALVLSCHLVPHMKPLLLSGYLIGYLVHWKKDLVPSCTASSLTFEDPPPPQTHDIPLMDWDNVKKLIAQKVTADKFEPIFR